MQSLLGDKYLIQVENGICTVTFSNMEYVTRSSKLFPFETLLPDSSGVLSVNGAELDVTIKEDKIFIHHIKTKDMEITIEDQKFMSLTYKGETFLWDGNRFKFKDKQIKIFNFYPLIISLQTDIFTWIGGTEGLGIIWNSVGGYVHIIELKDNIVKNAWLANGKLFTDFCEDYRVISEPSEVFKSNNSLEYIDKLSKNTDTFAPVSLSQKLLQIFGFKEPTPPKPIKKRYLEEMEKEGGESEEGEGEEEESEEEEREEEEREEEESEEEESEEEEREEEESEEKKGRKFKTITVLIHDLKSKNIYVADSITAAGQKTCELSNHNLDRENIYMPRYVSAYLKVFENPPYRPLKIGNKEFVFTREGVHPKSFGASINIVGNKGLIMSANTARAIKKLTQQKRTRGRPKKLKCQKIAANQTPKGNFIITKD